MDLLCSPARSHRRAAQIHFPGVLILEESADVIEERYADEVGV
jgi:hypothetical protein